MKTALISVSDKTGIIEFANQLKMLGWKILASKNTCLHLQTHDIPATEISDYTQFPEILDGRVKTLHPKILGGILARETDSDLQTLKNLQFETIDLVIVNLYPFKEKPSIEQIDIGGVTLLRAAAKNYERVTAICDPSDYKNILTEINTGEISLSTRKSLAAKVFALTSELDQCIMKFLSDDTSKHLTLFPIQTLRYGENPHQKAEFLGFSPNQTPFNGKILQGKELSYNNLLDLDAALRCVTKFEKPTVAIVKHASPCGIASAENIANAFTLALKSDPISAFGGIIATNQIFDEEVATRLDTLFVECIAAPKFSEKAKEMLANRLNCRLLEVPYQHYSQQIRSVGNGILWQEDDSGDPQNTDWQVVTNRKPTEQEYQSLQFAWKACIEVRSNAIILCQQEATVGIGGGQPNRIDALKLAIERAGENARHAVMASDGFFPFKDSIITAKNAGITAIIQPGGAKRDPEIIEAANEANIAMVYTGIRHFKH